MDGFIRHFAELKTWMTGPRPAMTMGHGPAMTVNRMGFGWQVLVFERDRPDWNHLFGRTVIARSEAVAGLDPAKQSGAERAPHRDCFASLAMTAWIGFASQSNNDLAVNDQRAALSLGCRGRDLPLADMGGELAAAVAGQSCSDPGSGLCR
jgi:hypothetical protein